MSLGVVLVAAGTGQRLGGVVPKVLVELAGRSLLAHALDGLARAGMPPPVVVHTPGYRDAFVAALEDRPVTALVSGGASRTDSVRAGLAALDDDVTLVAVHDAARALMPPQVMRRCVAAVHGEVLAAAPATAVADTLKRVAGTDVLGTVDRSELVAVQTPQVLPRRVLEAVLAEPVTATDELGLVEQALVAGRLTGRVVVVEGSRQGMKITVPEDLIVAEALLRAGQVRS